VLPDERDELLLRELHQIRREIQALRRAFEERGQQEEFARRISDLEVEQRLYEIEQELTHEAQPKPKRRMPFKRR
jgi:hypothetical protein